MLCIYPDPGPAGTRDRQIPFRICSCIVLVLLLALVGPVSAESPVVISISPSYGPESGGTVITVKGDGFIDGPLLVKMGSVYPAYTRIDMQTLTVTSPAGLSGTVDIQVTNFLDPPSDITDADKFTFIGAPRITSVSPASGPTASGPRLGGTTVMVNGTNLTYATAVRFGTAAGTIVSNTPTSIAVKSPDHAAGTVDVRVTTPGGTSAVVAGDKFTYTALRPKVTAISPPSGPLAGGTTVTITGTGLSYATAVKFGTAAGTIVANTPTGIIARSPAHAAGTVDVTVTTAGGTSAVVAGDRFKYVAAPAITSLSPKSGTHLGGTIVTITGTGLSDAMAVKFGTILSGSATKLTVKSPAHAAGTVDVRVTTDGGTSAVTAADRFTYT